MSMKTKAHIQSPFYISQQTHKHKNKETKFEEALMITIKNYNNNNGMHE